MIDTAIPDVYSNIAHAQAPKKQFHSRKLLSLGNLKREITEKQSKMKSINIAGIREM